jgi:2-polyprenyl-3-methyl-5-hydroxy-6-metoxy-1,4-benzoquinol methylase
MESIYESQVDPLRPNDAHGISLQLVGQGKTVLELGAASGHVTKVLKEMNNKVTAVERDGRFADILGEFADEVVITDLDWLDLRERLAGQKFDVVLAGDVLEHCSKPELVLLQLHDLLNPGGYVVISLPNIAHGDVRLALLRGEFNYRDTGLLDRTHIRFFTRSSIESFLNQNAFKLVEVFASTASIGTTEFGPPDAGIPVEAIKFVQQDRDAMVYQYIVKATPVPTIKRDTFSSPPQRTTDARVDQLFAEVCLYQEAVSQCNALNKQESDRVYQSLQMVETLNEQLLTSQHETDLANIRVQEEQQKALRYLQIMEANGVKLNEAQLAMLNARDHAIGAAAELGEIRHQHEKALREIDSLVHQLNLLRGSRTWRIGRFVLLPLRALRKALRLIMS